MISLILSIDMVEMSGLGRLRGGWAEANKVWS